MIVNVFLKKSDQKICDKEKRPYLCIRKNGSMELTDHCLGYGVMVTLQILVLSFLVRVRVPQHDKARHFSRDAALFFYADATEGVLWEGRFAQLPTPSCQASSARLRGGPW